MKVADVLALPELRRGLPEVAAGREQLDREVRWVHAGEVHDIASLLRGGEMLLTTGMGIGATAAEQRRFIAELSDRDVAAVVIELGYAYESELPSALVAESAKRALPLVVLHASVPFVDVTEAVHSSIVNADHAALRDAEALGARFTEAMLDGGGVPEVLGVLAQTLGNPVVLERADGGLGFVASPAGAEPDIDPVSAWSQARGQEPPGTAVDVPGQAGGRLVVVPVLTTPVASTSLALERAANTVALAFLRSRQEDELLAYGRGDLLGALADGRVDASAAEARAHAMGFSGGQTLLPLAARLSGVSWRAALREVERGFTGLGLPALLGLRAGGHDLLLLLGGGGSDRTALADRAVAVLAPIVARRELPQPVVAAGPVGGWADASDGLRDAVEAVALAEVLPAAPWHDATSMALERLVWQLRDRPEVARFAERLLGPVLEHDAARPHPLLPTLEALCDHGGHRAAVARALHLNRQAVYDRIARLEHVLDADLSDPRTLLALQVAVQVHRLRP